MHRSVLALVTLVGLTGSLLAAAPEAVAATAPAGRAGSLDTTFGSGGIATLTVPGETLAALSHVLVQPDGKLVVGGVQPNVAGSVVVARLNANGSVDTSFGGGKGYVKPGLGSSSLDAITGWGVSGLRRGDIALQPDGRIVVTSSDMSGTKVAVARLKTDGSMDTTFGSSGIVTTPLGGGCGGAPTHGSGVQIQPDSKILVSAWNGSGCNATVLRYSSTGALDGTFGSGGIAQAPIAGRSVQAQDLALTPDGRVVVVGISKVGGSTDTTVVRFTSSGRPDTTFPASNSNGTITFDVGNGLNEFPTAVTLDAAGRIIVTGNVSTTPLSPYVLRLSSTGAVDATFGTNGVLRGTFGGATATAAGVVIDSSGRLLVAGGDGPSTSNALGIERLLPSGAVPYDAAFGLTATPGRETIACGTGTGRAKAVALQANQQIVLAGSCNGALKIARLNPGNISNLTMTATSPTAAAGHQVIPLSSIPAGVLLGFAGAFAGSDLHDSALFGAPFHTSVPQSVPFAVPQSVPQPVPFAVPQSVPFAVPFDVLAADDVVEHSVVAAVDVVAGVGGLGVRGHPGADADGAVRVRQLRGGGAVDHPRRHPGQ